MTLSKTATPRGRRDLSPERRYGKCHICHRRRCPAGRRCGRPGAAAVVAAVVDAFGDPDATGVVDVHVGGVIKIRSGSPDGDVEITHHLEGIDADGFRGFFGFPVGLSEDR